MKQTDPAVSSMSASLVISSLWWKMAKVTPHKKGEIVELTESNEHSFLEKLEVGDIFQGETKGGGKVQGFITSKKENIITLEETFEIS